MPWAREEPARRISQLADSVAWYSSLMPVSAFLRASFDEAYSIFGLTEALSSDLHSGPQRRERRAATCAAMKASS